jgi:hypothetical protein
MKLYRARFGFYDDEWCGDELKTHYVSDGSVGCFDQEPNLKYWEPIEVVVKPAESREENSK